jgi:hypothetical protein
MERTTAVPESGEWSRTSTATARWAGSAATRIAAATVVLAMAAFWLARQATVPLDDPTLWAHLSTGTWMLHNHALPHTGLFSQLSGLRWLDFNWGVEFVLAVFYKALGLYAIVVLSMALKTGVALSAFVMARGWRGNFWPALGLALVAEFILRDGLTLTALVSVLFFAAELVVLFEVHRSGKLRGLYWLPVLFVVWANCDSECVTGLLLLALYLLVVLAKKFAGANAARWMPQGAPVPLQRAGVVAGACLLASMLSPAGYHIFAGVFDDIYSAAAFRFFGDFRAMDFRHAQHYLTVLLVMGAFFALGRHRNWDVFKLALLAICAALAFRIQRDLWLAVLSSVAILGDELSPEAEAPRTSGRERALFAAVLAVVFVALAVIVPPPRAELSAHLAGQFPQQACDFIRNNHLPAPLFNPINWGGFLSWYLPEYPVSVDSRVGLYGSEYISQHFATMSGNRLLEDDPSFANANTILLERNSGIARAITTLPRLKAQYKVLYSDDLALVVQRTAQ